MGRGQFCPAKYSAAFHVVGVAREIVSYVCISCELLGILEFNSNEQQGSQGISTVHYSNCITSNFYL